MVEFHEDPNASPSEIDRRTQGSAVKLSINKSCRRLGLLVAWGSMGSMGERLVGMRWQRSPLLRPGRWDAGRVALLGKTRPGQ